MDGSRDNEDLLAAVLPRADYASLGEAVYLNQAALGLLGRPAVEAMHRFLDDVGRHGNLHLSDEDEVAYLGALRAQAAAVLGTDESQVALLSGASELLGQAPLLLAPPADRTVVLVATDFPAVTRPWLLAEDRGGPGVHFVLDTATTDLTDAVVAAVDETTAVVAVGSVQYATGSRVDVPRLRAATDAVGARLVIDASQEAGAEPIDAAAWDADLIVSSGYKWLGGHGGVAIGAIHESLLDRPPPLPGWMGTPDPFSFDATRLLLAEGGRRYTQSTMSYVSVAGLTAAITELLAVGAAEISGHAETLGRHLLEGLRPFGWRPFRDLDAAGAARHLISLGREGDLPADTLSRLTAARIVCGSRGGRIRVSLAPYNDGTDIDALIAALSSLPH